MLELQRLWHFVVGDGIFEINVYYIFSIKSSALSFGGNDFKKEVSKGIFIDDKGNIYIQRNKI